MRQLGKGRSCMSNDDPKTCEALRWLRFSREDLDVATRLIKSTFPPFRHICWLSQQSAEKAIKAALMAEGIFFQRIHDLDALLDILPDGWDVRDMYGDLSYMTEWAVEARYPSDRLEPSHDDAIRAESQARLIHNSIAAEFKRRSMLI